MVNATPARIGQVNGGGAVDALFLKQFGGEVMGIFMNNHVALDRHIVRSISSGKTAQFPAYGRVSASYHTPGNEILGQAMNRAERTISVDDLLLADVTLAQIDDLQNHYDVRGPYAEELAYALVNKADQNVLQVALNAARGSATVTGGVGGLAITSASSATVASALITTLYSASQNFDEKNVPVEGRQVFIKPAQYYLLAATSSVQSSDFNRNPGDQAMGLASPYIAGLELVKTNNVPSTNISTGPTAYQGNFSTSVCVATHKSAVGTLKLLDLVMEITWDPRRKIWLITACYSMGHGILRPESAVEVKTA